MIEKKNKTILGIDPGSNFMGFGIIEYNKQNLKLIFYDVLIINKSNNQFKKLKVYKGADHPHAAQNPVLLNS